MDERELERLFPKKEDPELEDALKFVEELRSGNADEEAPITFRTVTSDEENLSDVQAAEDAAEVPAAVPRTEEETAGKADKKTDGEPKPPFIKRVFRALFPIAGDPWWEVGRKLLFLVGLVVLVGALAMLLNESVIIPQQNAELTEEIQRLLVESRNGELTDEEAAYDGYPEGIVTDFKKLYYLNNDVRGWITYPGCNIDQWIMYSRTQDYYLYRDIYKNSNKNGSLFFDVHNDFSGPNVHYKSTVVYGHNMASGQMFARLNELAGSVDTMRRAGSIITLSTLYDTAQYKIFAVVLQDSVAKMEHYYSIQATGFNNNAEFMTYVQGLRDRSLYDFGDVDVNENDELLILYTCAPKSVAKFDDARLGVIARKVRSGESATVKAESITENKDVIMPYAWYAAQKKKVPAIYAGTTAPTGKTTTASGGSTTATGSAVTTSGSGTEGSGTVIIGPGSTGSQPVAGTTVPVPSGSSATGSTPSVTGTTPVSGSTAPVTGGSDVTTDPAGPTVTAGPTETTVPTASTEAPVTDPTAPVATTEVPAAETTEVPAAETTEAPVTEPTAAPVTEPTAAETTEAPVTEATTVPAE